MFKNLLLALDVQAPESSVRSAQAAVSLARTEGATLHVLNVVPDSGMPIVGASLSADLLETARRSAESELEEWAKQAIPDDVACVLHITEGTIYDQIIKMSDKLEIDAIIVSAHRPELKDYLIGPNSARVARHAKQSVFVIR